MGEIVGEREGKRLREREQGGGVEAEIERRKYKLGDKVREFFKEKGI
jgi:hypothetical protein